ncbi:MAG: ABC transporter permease [Ignavibacteria bacterium]|nr:ABC transporter permease [Ignavibacteria bacterium]MBI3766162.1 ABC transporter permease [Ignavibacteriales bacterium]
MIKHFLKMVWNRKRINGLIMIEIFFSFVVLFTVITATVYYVSNYRKPLGFSIDRVWSISVNTRLPWKTHMKEKVDGMNQLTLALRGLPEIESIGGISMVPYSRIDGIYGADYNGRPVETHMNHATDGLKDVLTIELTAGRWFSSDDDAAKSEPAIINERLAKDLFGSDDPLGKEIPFASQHGKPRVVGIVKDFRKSGEFSQPVNYMISRIKSNDTTELNLWDILIKVKPGTTAAFQERLVKTMETVAKNWTFDVVRLEHERESDFKLRLAPLIAGGLIASFLLIMVALGLIGVLWQNVSQRTKEIGLRRAMGGTAQHVYRQILGEQFVITTLGVLVGSILVMQVPLLDLIGFIQPGTYIAALTISLILMYALTYLCSLFPSWLAMDIEPAEALHYE